MNEMEVLKATCEMLMFYVDWILKHGTFDRQLTAQELIDLTNHINEKFPGVKGEVPARVKEILDNKK